MSFNMCVWFRPSAHLIGFSPNPNQRAAKEGKRTFVDPSAFSTGAISDASRTGFPQEDTTTFGDPARRTAENWYTRLRGRLHGRPSEEDRFVYPDVFSIAVRTEARKMGFANAEVELFGNLAHEMAKAWGQRTVGLPRERIRGLILSMEGALKGNGHLADVPPAIEWFKTPDGPSSMGVGHRQKEHAEGNTDASVDRRKQRGDRIE